MKVKLMLEVKEAMGTSAFVTSINYKLCQVFLKQVLHMKFITLVKHELSKEPDGPESFLR